MRVIHRTTGITGVVVPVPARKGRLRGTVRADDAATTFVRWDGCDEVSAVPTDDLIVPDDGE